MDVAKETRASLAFFGLIKLLGGGGSPLQQDRRHNKRTARSASDVTTLKQAMFFGVSMIMKQPILEICLPLY